RAVDKIPPHVELMRRLELADYEPGSDSGNMRFYPKGTLVKRLLEAHVLDTVGETNAVEVETPVMYDVNHPTLKKYLDRFPARQYSIESDKRSFFLRFAACFGQFLMNHDMTISHRNLPLKMVEMTRYSFRREQHGELVGLRRLRAFTMPDMHTLCADMDHAILEFKDQYTMCMKMLADIGLQDDYEVAIRFTRDFYTENKDFVKELVRIVGKPALIELWDSRFFYFVIKFEFNYIDALKKASALSTVQIDVENAERYDINYIDKNGDEQRPTILHCSPSGAIERCIYALLEKAHLTSKAGGVPSLPTWLSPTQVRLIPVAERHIGCAEEIAAAIVDVRVDIDDRDETVGKRVRAAGREWIPYVVVIGDKELESGVLSVTIRSESQKVEETAQELRDRVLAETAGMPYRQINLPVLLSKRPIFFG
ncbi:MAG: threonine--tRNA ligase, partial [Candidatus Methanogasteraceae archaeon]